MFKKVHPTETARTGAAETSIEDKEATKYYCKQCGFRCDSVRDGLGDGEMIVYPNATAQAISKGAGSITVDATTQFLAAGDAVIYDSNPMHSEGFIYTSKTATTFTVSSVIKYDHIVGCIVRQASRVPKGSGCPFCGSRNWR